MKQTNNGLFMANMHLFSSRNIRRGAIRDKSNIYKRGQFIDKRNAAFAIYKPMKQAMLKLLQRLFDPKKYLMTLKIRSNIDK